MIFPYLPFPSLPNRAPNKPSPKHLPCTPFTSNPITTIPSHLQVLSSHLSQKKTPLSNHLSTHQVNIPLSNPFPRSYGTHPVSVHPATISSLRKEARYNWGRRGQIRSGRIVGRGLLATEVWVEEVVAASWIWRGGVGVGVGVGGVACR